MLDAAKIKKELPYLEDYKKNVLEWIEDLKEYLLLYDITEPKKAFNWVLAAVEDDVKDAIRVLVTRRNEEERYPRFSEIQKAVEDHLEITEGDKWAVLRNLTIGEEESMKQFNHRYRKLYHNLSRDYQKLITVKEYKEAISPRVFPCSQVSISKVDNLQEAYKIAELAETTEKEIQERNEELLQKKKSGTRNVSMVIQNGNYMTNHSIYKSFKNREAEAYQNRGNPGYIGNSQGYGRYRNGEYQPGGYYGRQSVAADRRFMGDKNIKERQDYTKSRAKKVTLTTTDEEAKGTPYRNVSSIKCFRCNQPGHKSPECPYTFKELAEMEAKGLLN